MTRAKLLTMSRANPCPQMDKGRGLRQIGRMALRREILTLREPRPSALGETSRMRGACEPAGGEFRMLFAAPVSMA